MSRLQGLYSAFVDTAIVAAVRTPWIDCAGALAGAGVLPWAFAFRLQKQ